ncbi:MAG TPA: copper amine oxidase N-terminal domain-containing protein [Symbiobacteriaceae bacterium]|nr:copper amine oxidase N-terminal domain-containing protein [Symbiobacteriaceae bacterium]
MAYGRPKWLRLLALAGAVALAVAFLPDALAHHGDIHARCDGDKPVVTVRPPGLDYIQVVCVDGVPEFVVTPEPVFAYDPVTQSLPRATPPDFGGWVTVWLNGRLLKTPYDPVRGVQEPGPYVAASTGRVMMPVRFFTEAFGGQVEWNQQEQRAQLKMPGRAQAITLWLAQNEGMVGFRAAKLDQKPVLFLDRMFVPVRFLTEGFGGDVTWDHGNRSARVQMSGVSCVNAVYCGK